MYLKNKEILEMQKLVIEMNEILCFYEFLHVLQMLHKLEKKFTYGPKKWEHHISGVLAPAARETNTFSWQKSNIC
jgi:hypothetical protein